MPFNPTPTFPAAPLLTVNFSGLLVIKPYGSSCYIGVHNAESHHMLRITLKIIRPNDAPVEQLLRTAYLVKSHFMINVSNGVNGIFSAFNPRGEFHRDRLLGDDGRDLRWGINLESHEFHDENLGTVDEKLRYGVMINGGAVFCTAERTDEASITVRRNRGTERPIDMTSIASVIAARIEILVGGEVRLNWEDASPISLPRDGDPFGTTYELHVKNDPPGDYVDPEELVHYYEVLTKSDGSHILDNEKWKLTVAPVGPHDEKTDEIPCMPILLDP